VGYGSVPNAVLANLAGKKHLGLHSELFSDGVAELMKAGAWTIQKRASIEVRLWPPSVWESKETYDYLHKNQVVEFRSIDYTNHLLS